MTDDRPLSFPTTPPPYPDSTDIGQCYHHGRSLKGQRRGRGSQSANVAAATSAAPSLLLDPPAHDHAQIPVSSLSASPQPAVLTTDQLRQVTESVAALMRESQRNAVEPASSPFLDEASAMAQISTLLPRGGSTTNRNTCLLYPYNLQQRVEQLLGYSLKNYVLIKYR
ncbi:uncharacterized protein LOC134262771 [Saccostrea cucullata]|uniref:uncharacterized protein LOC134262771 n=1 Tax=Saccostrea cuccullata TaxID=36930 RepID=UPI002ED156CD